MTAEERPSFQADPTAYRREYQRAYRRGVRRTLPLELRLLAKTDRVNGPVLVESLGPCWPWLGACNSSGYGLISEGGRLYLAHRIALSMALGRDLAPGMVSRHRCDNPPCIRPSHLQEGSQTENVREAVMRGRHAGFRRLIDRPAAEAVA
jgi:hypothetical protein